MHGALADPHRLAIVDDLAAGDRTPSELAERFAMSTNLLAHHLDVLESVGLIQRSASSGDRRRRYVQLRRSSLDLPVPTGDPPTRSAPLFVCTHNSARSQLAAALWRRRTGVTAASAGTHPANGVHPGAMAAADRAGLGLGRAHPRLLTPADRRRPGVITVCDRAHEELEPGDDWLHWSIPDPVESRFRRAFDDVLAELDERISYLTT